MQDVAPRDAGLILALTNTCGTVVGVAGNVATGMLAQGGGYGAVFALTALLYLASFILWNAFMRGQPLSLSAQ